MYMCVCVIVCVCACACGRTRRPEVSNESPDASHFLSENGRQMGAFQSSPSIFIFIARNIPSIQLKIRH